jgi:hypothetical protein
LTDQFFLAVAPIVSLMILAGIAGIYFAQKERRESQEADAKRHR